MPELLRICDYCARYTGRNFLRTDCPHCGASIHVDEIRFAGCVACQLRRYENTSLFVAAVAR